MRHRKSGRQLGRNTHHRRALFRNLVTSLLEHERIETTEAKAKEIRILADRMITLAKRGDLPARRRALAYVRTQAVVAKLFKDLAGRFSARPGGYTRLIKTRRRVGDAACMVVIELVARSTEKKQPPKKEAGAQPEAGGEPTKAGSSRRPKESARASS
jgi:large subunit ribosomal protein L17